MTSWMTKKIDAAAVHRADDHDNGVRFATFAKPMDDQSVKATAQFLAKIPIRRVPVLTNLSFTARYGAV
jgi:hypothetical protein